ncbi:MAG: hypothetical protein WBM99_09880 [Psychromonas sp.]
MSEATSIVVCFVIYFFFIFAEMLANNLGTSALSAMRRPICRIVVPLVLLE